MSEPSSLITALMAGLLVGLLYFGGLWLTVSRLLNWRHPALVTLGSFIGRLSLMLLVFYAVTDGNWVRIALYLLGFFVMRSLLIWRWQPRFSPQSKGDC